MPRTGDMIESKFMKKEDVGTGKLLTMRNVKRENVAMKDQAPEEKWCAMFDEIDKPMVLNSTNLSLFERALGSDNTDDWIGKQVVLFNDENVSFGGVVTGGIRVDVNRTKRYYEKKAANGANGQQRPAAAGPAKPNPAAGTKFEDFEDEDRKRHLLRLWLRTDHRPLAPEFAERFGPGTARMGVPTPESVGIALRRDKLSADTALSH